MIELVLSDTSECPSVQCLPGPRIILTMNMSDDINTVLRFCRDDLLRALNWAVFNIYQGEQSPARVYQRNVDGSAMSIMTDPCEIFGLDAFVRPQNLEGFQNFGR